MMAVLVIRQAVGGSFTHRFLKWRLGRPWVGLYDITIDERGFDEVAQ